MKQKEVPVMPLIYQPGVILIAPESPGIGFFATHWLEAKMEEEREVTRFIYTFVKVGFIPPETPVSECTFQFNSETNAFKVGQRVSICKFSKSMGSYEPI